MSGHGDSGRWREQRPPEENTSNTREPSTVDPNYFMRLWQQEGLRSAAASPQITGPNETRFHETHPVFPQSGGTSGRSGLRRALDRHLEALNAPSPAYQSEQPFPRAPGLIGGYIRGEQVRLSKVDIANTWNFVNREPNTQQTFGELREREKTLRYWIDSHQGAFRGATTTSIDEYNEVSRKLNTESSAVKSIISARSQARSHGMSALGPSIGELESAIRGYKTAFSDLLDVAQQLRKTIYPEPEPPAYPVNEAEHGI